MATGPDFELHTAAEMAAAGFADTDSLVSGVSTIFNHVDDPRIEVFRTARKDLQNLFKQFAEVYKEAAKLPESDYNSTDADDEVFEKVQDVDDKRVNFCIALVQWLRALTNTLDGHNENDRIYLNNVAAYVERKRAQLKARPFLIESNKKSEEMNRKCVLPTTSMILPATKRLCLDDTFDSTQPNMKNPRQISPSCFTEMDEGETQPEIIAIDGYLAPPAAHGGIVPPSNGDATRPRLTSTSRRLSFGRAATQMSQQDQELAEKRQKEAQSRAEHYERERVAAEEAERKLAERTAQMEERKKAMAYQEEIRLKEAAARKAAEEEKAKEEEKEKAIQLSRQKAADDYERAVSFQNSQIRLMRERKIANEAQLQQVEEIMTDMNKERYGAAAAPPTGPAAPPLVLIEGTHDHTPAQDLGPFEFPKKKKTPKKNPAHQPQADATMPKTGSMHPLNAQLRARQKAQEEEQRKSQQAQQQQIQQQQIEAQQQQEEFDRRQVELDQQQQHLDQQKSMWAQWLSQTPPPQ